MATKKPISIRNKAGDNTILSDSSDKEYKKVYCKGRLGWVS